MSEREELRREFSFENAIPNGPWYTFDTEKALDEIAALRAQLTTAERERDEARATVEAQRVVLDGMHRRAELSEHVVKAVAGLAEVDVINGGEYFDDICVQPVLAAYHRYALDAAERPNA